MATPIPSNFTRLTSADLLKFKHYLIESVGRTFDGNEASIPDRTEFMKQRLSEVYAQVKVNLPEDLRQQLFKDILDELTEGQILAIDKQAEILNCGICAYDFEPDAQGLCVPKLALWNHGAPMEAEGTPKTAEPDMMTGTR